MRDPSTVEAGLVALLRELSRRAGRSATEAEARAALAPLSLREEETLMELADREEPPARPLGPMGWADLARGVPAHTAAARELAGYYELQAERDALAQVLNAKNASATKSNATATPKSSATRAVKTAAPAKSTPPEPAPREVELQHRPIEKKPLPLERMRAEKQHEPKADDDRREEKKPAAKKLVARRGDTESTRAVSVDDPASRMLTLFAYHRDTPLVAKALGWSLAELEAEVDRLQLRRKTAKLLRGLDTEMPAATARRSTTTPVRRRSAKDREETAARQESEKAIAALAMAEEATRAADELRQSNQGAGKRTLPRAKQSARSLDESGARGSKDEATDLPRKSDREPADERRLAKAAPGQREHLRAAVQPSAIQGDELRAILREVGPRRVALAQRLGSQGKPLSPAALLARFRAAGLEREFGQRERDLIRALLSRHRASLSAAAAELSVNKHALEELIRERGLSREIESQREGQRTSARASRWPKARIAQLLERRDWLSDLGVLDELEKDAKARLKLIWKELPAGPGRLESLAAQLGIEPDEARALASQLSLG